MASQPQNPEFRIHPENFDACIYVVSYKMKFKCLDDQENVVMT